eukprot:1159443-Pelagomonas_calceolata.AAC.5
MAEGLPLQKEAEETETRATDLSRNIAGGPRINVKLAQVRTQLVVWALVPSKLNSMLTCKGKADTTQYPSCLPLSAQPAHPCLNSYDRLSKQEPAPTCC